MTSAIDVTVPIYGNPTTKSVRDNFATAHDEIGALQTDVTTKVNRSGDTMTGFLSLYLDPELPTHAATKSYVDAMAFTGGGGSVTAQLVTVSPAIAGLPGANVYDALVSTFPKAGGTFTGGISFGANIGANTGDASKHITLYDGFAGFSITPNRMNAFAGAALGSGAAFFVTINGLDRLAVAEDLVSITAPLVLPADPILALHAATKQYVDSKSGGASLTVADTPPTIANGKMWFDSNKTQLYVGYDDGTSSQWVIANNPNVVATGAINTALQPSYNNVGRNLLHNSMFNIQQRGSGAFTVGGYTSDRWWQWFVGGTLSTTIRATTDAERTAIGDESCRYCFQSSMVMGAPNQRLPGDYKGFSQAIEDVRKLAGKTVTVSFWATGSAGMKLGVSIDQQFGTGGSSAVVGVGQAVALTTTFKRYSLTFVVPSIVGKTVGTSNDKTDLHFWLSSSFAYSVQSGSVGEQSGTISVWGVQLEIGNVTTPLEKPDPQVDLANCKRFYQNADIYQSWSNGVAGHGTQTSCVLPYGMRSNPTLTIIDVSGNVNVTGFGIYCISRQGNIVVYTGGTVTTSNASSYINAVFSASADL